VEAAKARWAVYFVSSSPSLEMMNEVMELLEKCGPTRTSGALQLELDVIGSFQYNHQPKYTTGSAARAELGTRIAELGQNPLVRTNPWSLVVGTFYPKMAVMAGLVPFPWEGGKRVDSDSIFKGVSMWYNQATPLMQSACDTAVGARKVMLMLSCAFCNTRNTDTLHALCSEGVFHVHQAYVHAHNVSGLSVCYGGERVAVPSRYR
jgi:hypothetical protein